MWSRYLLFYALHAPRNPDIYRKRTNNISEVGAYLAKLEGLLDTYIAYEYSYSYPFFSSIILLNISIIVSNIS